ncbi:hypothetical protein [Arachnia propionica]|uniref:Uncharacterized protein n=1 Tax=Arachnia propionica TaxID=1750 RepID=A0A3P1WXL8_9ACTN|nr:hypothetical protein [Arachnia propionica]RRD51404.1 hypothetical protein EII35_00535 [Arachnia propionica]
MTEGQISWFSIVLLAGHGLLAGVGAWSLWVIGGGWWLGLVAAILFVLAYAVVWRLWLAPAGRLRLGYKERLVVHLTLGPAVVVLAVLANAWLIALVGVSLVLLGDALARGSRPREVDSR